MKNLVLAGILTCIGLGAQAAVLDFETLPGGGAPTKLMGGSVADHTPFLVGNIYSALGVTFSSDGETDPEMGPIFGDLTGFAGANTVVQDYKRDGTVGATFNIRADFSLLQTMLSVDVFSATGESVTMTAYDSMGMILGAATSGLLTLGTGEALSLTGIGAISHVIWQSSAPFSASVGIDNLSFTSPVPLPAGGVLLMSALAGAAALRRARKMA